MSQLWSRPFWHLLPDAVTAPPPADDQSDVGAFLLKRWDLLDPWFFLTRTALSLCLVGYLAVDLFRSPILPPAALGAVLLYLGLNAAAYLLRDRVGPLLGVAFAAVDVGFVLLLRYGFWFEALVDPNATMVGLFSLILVGYASYGNPRLIVALGAVMLGTTVATMAGEVLGMLSVTAAWSTRLHPLRGIVLTTYLGAIAAITYGLTRHLLVQVTNYSRALQTRMRSAMHTAVERAQRERLEELNNLKRTFITLLSREIRQPLTPLATSLGIVRAELPEDAPSQEIVAIALEASQRLERLVDDYTRLANLLSEEAPPARLATVRVSDLFDELDRKHPSDRFVFEATEEALITTDPPLFVDVLLALLRRAESAASPSEPVRVDAVRRADRVVVSIHDPSGSMDAAAVRLDNPFAYPGAPGSGASPAGFELVLAQHALRRIGGHLNVVGEPRRGTTVRCSLPAASPGAAPISLSKLREHLNLLRTPSTEPR